MRPVLKAFSMALISLLCYSSVFSNHLPKSEDNPEKTVCLITGNSLVCENQSANYSVPPPTQNGVYTYVWSVTGGVLTGQLDNTCAVTWSGAGSGTISVSIYSGNTLIDNCSMAVSISATPDPQIIPSFTGGCDDGGEKRVNPNPDASNAPEAARQGGGCLGACANLPTNYKTPVVGNNTYSWEITAGAGQITTPANQNEITVIWFAPGNYSITVTETNAAGCSTSVTECVVVSPSPAANFYTIPPAIPMGGMVTICKDQSVSFTDISTADPSSPIEVWSWIFEDGGNTEYITQYSGGQTVSHTYLNPGIHLARLIVRNTCGCISEYRVKIYVIEDSNPAPSLDCIKTLCGNESATYNLQTNGGCNTYTWTVIGGTANIPPNVISPNITVQWDCSQTQHKIIVTPVNCGACTAPTAFDIPVICPSTTITGPTTVCVNKEAVYYIPPMPGSVFNWTISPANAGYFTEGKFTNNVKVVWNSAVSSATLSVTYNNPALECGGAATINVNIRPEMFIQASPSIDVCFNTPISYSAYTFVNGVQTPVVCDWVIRKLPAALGGIYTFSNVSTTPSFVILAPGNYEVIATEVGMNPQTCEPGKIYTKVISIEDHSGLVLGPVTNICPGKAYSYSAQPTAAGYTLLWTATNGTVSPATGNNVSITWGATGPYSFTIRQITSTGFPACSSAVRTIPVTAIVAPTCAAYPISGSENPCPDSYQNYSFPLTGLDNYQWTLTTPSGPTAGSITLGQGTNTVQVLWHARSTTAILTLTATYCGVNTVVCSKTINIGGIPTVSEIAGPSSVCQGSLNSWSITATPSTSLTVDWFWGDGTSTLGGGLVAFKTYTTPGTYTLIAKVSNTCNQLGAPVTYVVRTKTIIVKPNGAPNFSVTGPTCLVAGSSTTIQANTNGSSCTYTWYLNNVFYASGNPITIGYGNLPAGTSSLRVEVNCDGCINSSTMTLQKDNCTLTPCLAAQPYTLNFTSSYPAGSACGTVNFNLQTSGTRSSFSYGDGSPIITSPPANLTYTYTNVGVYDARFCARLRRNAVSFVTCCTTKQVVIPIIADFINNFQCNPGSGYSTIFYDASKRMPNAPIIGQTWTVSPGGASSTAANPVFNLAPGNYNMTYTVTVNVPAPGSGTYTCSITKPFTVQAGPTSSFIVNKNPICEGGLAQFFPNVVNPQLVSSYEWDFGDGSGSWIQNTQHRYVGTGTYIVKLNVVDNFGCVTASAQNITVTSNNLNGTITPPGPVNVCAGGTSPTLTANVSSGSAPYTFLWNTGATTQSILAGNTVSREYFVRVTDNLACERQLGPTSVVVKPRPVFTITGKSNYCSGEFIQLTTDPVFGAGHTYAWTVSPAGVITGALNQPSLYISSGPVNTPITISLTVTNPAGCSGVFTKIITIRETPQVSIAASDVCVSQPVDLTASSSINPVSFAWNTGATSPGITVQAPGLYSVTATTQYGCSGTADIRLFPVEDFRNFMSSTCCTYYCDKEDVLLIGPSSPEATFDPDNSQNIYTYTWYRNVGGFITIVANTKDYVVPAGQSGEYYLEITTNHGCTTLSKVYNICFRSCEPCDVSITINKVTCIGIVNGNKQYQVELTVYNPTPGPAQLFIGSNTGSFQPVPVLLPATGNNIITVTYTDTPPEDAILCISEVKLVWGKDFDKVCYVTFSDLCAPLPSCDIPVCETDITIRGIECLDVVGGNNRYRVLIDVFNPYGAQAAIYFNSPQGSFENPTILPVPGWNTVSAVFTDNPPQDNIVCITSGRIVWGREGDIICTFEANTCIDLPFCGGIDPYCPGFQDDEIYNNDPLTCNTNYINPNRPIVEMIGNNPPQWGQPGDDKDWIKFQNPDARDPNSSDPFKVRLYFSPAYQYNFDLYAYEGQVPAGYFISPQSEIVTPGYVEKTYPVYSYVYWGYYFHVKTYSENLIYGGCYNLYAPPSDGRTRMQQPPITKELTEPGTPVGKPASASEAERKIWVAPNPANVQTRICLDNKRIINRIEVYTAAGALLRTIQSINNPCYMMQVSDLAKGTYLIKVTDSKNQVQTQRLQKL